MTDHETIAREWLSETPYLSFHPLAETGSPSNLPMTVATPEKVASLASLLMRTRDAALEDAVRIAAKVEADYEGDWSCPEFNAAADIKRDILALRGPQKP